MYTSLYDVIYVQRLEQVDGIGNGLFDLAVGISFPGRTLLGTPVAEVGTLQKEGGTWNSMKTRDKPNGCDDSTSRKTSRIASTLIVDASYVGGTCGGVVGRASRTAIGLWETAHSVVSSSPCPGSGRPAIDCLSRM